MYQSFVTQDMPQEARDRRRVITKAWKAYHGELQDPLKTTATNKPITIKSNRCRPIIDKGVSFLFGQEIKIEATEEAGTDETTIQDFIDVLWGDPDDCMTLLSQLAINGGVCGQAFIKIVPSDDPKYMPRLVVIDPTLVYVISDPMDCDDIETYVLEWTGAAGIEYRQIIQEDESSATWLITNYSRNTVSGVAATWVQIGDPEVWMYPFPPIVSCQNLPAPNEFWGTSDITPDLIAQNEALNFIQSNTGEILKFHAHPKTFATGVAAEQIKFAIDDIMCLPSKDSAIHTIEMTSNLQSSLDFAAMIRTDMDEQSRVPAVALGRMTDLPRGTISGVALKLLFGPLVEKTIQKQRLYGKLIREVTRRCLVICGCIPFENYASYKIAIHWQDLLPMDDLVEAQSAILLEQLGVSQATILQRLGYSPEDEVAKKALEPQKTPSQSANTNIMMSGGTNDSTSFISA